MPGELFVCSHSMRGDAGPQCLTCLREKHNIALLPGIFIPSWLPGEFAKILQIWISTMYIYIYTLLKLCLFNVYVNAHTMYVCIVVVYINTVNGLWPLEQPRRAFHPDRTKEEKRRRDLHMCVYIYIYILTYYTYYVYMCIHLSLYIHIHIYAFEDFIQLGLRSRLARDSSSKPRAAST